MGATALSKEVQQQRIPVYSLLLARQLRCSALFEYSKLGLSLQRNES
jgi:hypothetical protein